MIFLIVLTVVILIGFNGLYVGAEFSAVAARRTRISQLAAEGNRMAKAFQPILESTKDKDRYLAATQLGITVSSLVLGAYGQNVIAERLVDPLTVLIQDIMPFLTRFGIESTTDVAETAARSIAVTGVLIILTICQVIFGELFPKSVAIQYPEKVSLALLYPMKWSLWLLRPFIWFFNGSGTLLLRLLPFASDHDHVIHSPQEIEMLMTESHEGGMLDDQARQMLRNAFRLRDLTARQVMIHRTKMLTAPQNATVSELLKIAIEAGYTRIPIHSAKSADDIVGFVHVKDLFRFRVEKREKVDDKILREVLFVPETMAVIDVWEKLNNRSKYLAIVFDEFGSTTGMITLEDLIEEIFGELQDEFDNEMAIISRDKEGRIHLRGDLLVSDVNEYLELDLPEETADTIGGLIMSELGRPPEVGDEITINNIPIRVEQVEDYGLQEISLKPSPTNSIAPYSEWEVTDYE